MGCSHACTYCDGRAEKYFVEGNFSQDIRVRTNIPKLLEMELPKLREIAPIHLSSGISDIYQEQEKKYKLTRACSEILHEYDFHISLITKSSLVLRDIDNWTKVNKKGGFTLQMTLTTLDDNVRKIMEPCASSVNERLETIKAYKDAGCSVGIFMMPLLPGISDGKKSIEDLLEKLTELNVDYITPGALTLRPGRQKDFYLSKISECYPHLIDDYNNIYRENRASGSPSSLYLKKLGRIMDRTFNNLVTLPPHYYYRNSMPLYCELIILLEHMIQLYRYRDINVTSLETAYKKIKTFLSDEKRNFNRKRTLPGNYIDENLKFLLSTKAFNNIINNDKLTNFIEKVILDRKIFNYKTLKLED